MYTWDASGSSRRPTTHTSSPSGSPRSTVSSTSSLEAPRWLNKSVQLEVLRLCTGVSSGFSNAAAELRRRGADVMVCMREDETFRRAVLLILDAADGSGEEDAATLRGAVSEVLGFERRSWRAKGMGTFNLDPAELAWREQMERRLREGPR